MMSLKEETTKSIMTAVLLCATLVVCIGTCSLCVALSLRISSLEEELAVRITTPNMTPSLQNRKNKTFSCQPCSSLTLGPFLQDDPELKSFHRFIEDGVLICCSRTPQENGKLIKLLVKHQIAKETAKDLLNATHEAEPPSTQSTHPSSRSLAYAHLLVGPQNETGSLDLPPEQHPPIKNWLTSRNQALIRGLKVKDGQITIPRSGLYMVYSQVQFSDVHPPPEGDARLIRQYTHHVCRYNVIYANGGEECLMMSEITKYADRSTAVRRNPSYMSGIFKLNLLDTVFVRVSNTSVLSLRPISTYFGVVELT